MEANLYAVKSENGKTLAEHTSRECARREVDWQRRSGIVGDITIIEIFRDPSDPRYAGGFPKRFVGPWCAAKIEDFKEQHASRRRSEDIAEYFGSNCFAILAIAKRLGLPKRTEDPNRWERHKGKWTEREERLVNHLYDEGTSLHEIPRIIPRSMDAVSYRLRISAPTLSSRSGYGKFIARGSRRTIRKVLEAAPGDTTEE